MERAEPVVHLQGLAVAPRGGPAVVEAIDWSLRPGTLALVVGATGTGKTTLLRTLALLEPPAAGSYAFQGHATAAASAATRAAIRRRIGLALPDLPWLRDASVAVNLALPLRVQEAATAEIAQVVDDFLDWLGLAGRAAAPVTLLSAGERRLLGLARAAITRPDLLLADEPLAGLDRHAAGRVVRLLQELARLGAAVLVTTADAGAAKELGGETWKIDERRLRPADAAALRLAG